MKNLKLLFFGSTREATEILDQWFLNVCYFIWLVTALGVIVLWAIAAYGHEEDGVDFSSMRDPITGVICCNQHDCVRAQVREIEGGYRAMSVEWAGKTQTLNDDFPYNRVIWKSRSGHWYACVGHNGTRLYARCLVGTPPGS